MAIPVLDTQSDQRPESPETAGWHFNYEGIGWAPENQLDPSPVPSRNWSGNHWRL